MSRWENFDSFIPCIRNCLALIPSLATTLGFAYAGELTRAEAYELVGVLVCIRGDVMRLTSLSSVALMCLSSFSFVSSISV